MLVHVSDATEAQQSLAGAHHCCTIECACDPAQQTFAEAWLCLAAFAEVLAWSALQVIPRGGNALVSHVQHNTRIPVLGHADGICHLYVDARADISMACQVAVDSKADNPAACNAVEKILVHTDLAKDGRLYQLQVHPSMHKPVSAHGCCAASARLITMLVMLDPFWPAVLRLRFLAMRACLRVLRASPQADNGWMACLLCPARPPIQGYGCRARHPHWLLRQAALLG